MLTRYLYVILLFNFCFTNITADTLILDSNPNEEFIYKTKFRSLKVGKTIISIVNNNKQADNTTIITIEASSNRFIDMIYKLRHFSTIIVNTTDFSLNAITQKLQQGDYIDSYNATVDYEQDKIYYYNTKQNPSNKKQDSQVIKIKDKVYDPFSIVYHLRNMDLDIGNKYIFASYSKKKIRDVNLSIINTEYIKTPYLNGMCYVVVPNSENQKYLLKNQGEMKIWYTVNSPHIPLKIEQKMKHGIMELVLFNYVIKE